MNVPSMIDSFGAVSGFARARTSRVVLGLQPVHVEQRAGEPLAGSVFGDVRRGLALGPLANLGPGSGEPMLNWTQATLHP